MHKQNFSLFVNCLYCSKIFLLSSSLFLTLLAVVLQRVELVISSLLFDQLIMCSTFNDSSLFQNHDTIGVSYC